MPMHFLCHVGVSWPESLTLNARTPSLFILHVRDLTTTNALLKQLYQQLCQIKSVNSMNAD